MALFDWEKNGAGLLDSDAAYTNILHVEGDDYFTFVTTEPHCIEMLHKVASLHPAAEIAYEDDGCLIVYVPWDWVRVEIPTEGTAD